MASDHHATIWEEPAVVPEGEGHWRGAVGHAGPGLALHATLVRSLPKNNAIQLLDDRIPGNTFFEFNQQKKNDNISCVFS